jgi:hypothetical protein
MFIAPPHRLKASPSKPPSRFVFAAVVVWSGPSFSPRSESSEPGARDTSLHLEFVKLESERQLLGRMHQQVHRCGPRTLLRVDLSETALDLVAASSKKTTSHARWERDWLQVLEESRPPLKSSTASW